MSSVRSRTYDWPVPVTKSDTTDDAAGPFAGLLVTVAGNVVLWPLNGPQGSLPLTIPVIVGQELHFAVRRVGTTGTTATVFGLVDASVARQGPLNI